MTGKVDGATAHKVGDRARAGKAPGWFVHDLRLGDHGEDVYALTVVLGITPDSRFTPEVESAVRRVQSARGDAVTGMVTEAFASAIVQD